VISRSALPLLRIKSFEVASTINFALPACNCGVDFTPAMKITVLSPEVNGCVLEKTG
jgi:hypothetical protein